MYMELNFGLTSVETMYNDVIFRIDFVAHLAHILSVFVLLQTQSMLFLPKYC